MAHVLHGGRPARTTAVAGVVRSTSRFGLHLLEMCMAMCIGIMVLDVPWVAVVKWAGYSDPIRDLPQLAAVVVAFNMSLPMVLWMRFRGHHWQCIRDMTAAMFVEAFVLIALAGLGLFATASIVPVQHALMLPVMIAVMLLRLDVYTAPAHRGLVPA